MGTPVGRAWTEACSLFPCWLWPPAPAYGGYAPQPPPYYQPAPAYHHAVHHGYEHPKHNCSVLDVVEAAEVCTPALETVCNPVELARKSIKDVEQCYTVV